MHLSSHGMSLSKSPSKSSRSNDQSTPSSAQGLEPLVSYGPIKNPFPSCLIYEAAIESRVTGSSFERAAISGWLSVIKY